ncbi:disulfide bond formation protein B [Propionivibrio sp.]|uniref:disulfide bond formation protein B n=1 Tax=Propionivibrio sp. TaxID=2212460 RepID=UPI0026136183|nr:disulfide bond formation protein B [Propionivibrio sp.]
MRLSTRSVFALLTTASLGLLASGLVIGELARLQPCHLCNLQRLLYMVLAFFALCGVLLPGGRRLWCVFVVLAAGGGVITALQQSWMQYAPQQAIECGFGDPTLAERLINWLGTQWPAMFMVTGFCTNKEWVFLGLSLANWSGVCFALLLAGALWLLLRSETAR